MTEEETKKENGTQELVEDKNPEIVIPPFKKEVVPGFDAQIVDKERPDKRLPLNEEQKEAMDGNVARLGEIFAGSDINWQLDGALNISLMAKAKGGDYIGAHKDFDVSVEDADLEKLEEMLLKKRYKLFLSFENKDNPGDRDVEPVNAQRLRETTPDHYLIGAVDEKGNFDKGAQLNNIDLHIVKRDNDGNPTYRGNSLPKEWFEPRPIAFEGQTINLSHPAKVAFFKLHDDRPYDRTDLMILAQSGELSMKDVEEIEKANDREGSEVLNLAEQIIDKASAEIKKGMTADQIYGIFAKDPMVAQNIERRKDSLQELSQKISESECTKEEIRGFSFQIFDIMTPILKQGQKVRELRSWVGDAKELEQTRSDLQNKF
jgi:hypothetical protein